MSVDLAAGAASLLRRAARRWVPGLRPEGSLLLVVDRAGWVLDEIAGQIAGRLPPSFRCRVVEHEWQDARDCTIHFISRPWAWSDGVLDRVHASNRLIGLWWHGLPESDDPAMCAAVERLRRVHHRFDRLQVTGSIGRRTLTAVGVPADKIVTLPEGVNVDMFRPSDEHSRRAARAELGIGADALVVGCFQKDGDGWGQGDTPKMIKGPDVLVDAVARVNARTPVTALVPGPARGFVVKGLAAAGVAVCAPGFVPRAQVPSLYHAVDVYVSPSRDEGGPAGVLEAMASGLPVVSTRTGMAVDLFANGGGVLADVDAAPLADAVADLLRRPEDRQTMGRQARQTILGYDWSVLAPRYARELYEPLHRDRR